MSEQESRKRSPSPSLQDQKRVAMEDVSTAMPVKVAGTATATIRAIIDGKEAGSIIGKAGATINLIREKSGAKVTVSDNPAANGPQFNERVLSVTGNAEAIFRAFSFICEKIRDANTQPGFEAPVQVKLRIAIPNTQAGAVIGKGGQKIKDIREATGSQMQVDKECLPGSTERACHMTGTLEAVAQSIFHVACTLISIPTSSSLQPYQPGSAPVGMNPMGVMGGMAVQQQQRGNMPMYGGAMQSQYGGYGAPPPQPSSQPQLVEQLSIPNEVVGSIIGKQGAKIKEIRMHTGANIKVADNTPGITVGDRLITISGSMEAIQMAKYLIQKNVAEAIAANYAKMQGH